MEHGAWSMEHGAWSTRQGVVSKEPRRWARRCENPAAYKTNWGVGGGYGSMQHGPSTLVASGSEHFGVNLAELTEWAALVDA